jgi:hypothetical protein
MSRKRKPYHILLAGVSDLEKDPDYVMPFPQDLEHYTPLDEQFSKTAWRWVTQQGDDDEYTWYTEKDEKRFKQEDFEERETERERRESIMGFIEDNYKKLMRFFRLLPEKDKTALLNAVQNGTKLSPNDRVGLTRRKFISLESDAKGNPVKDEKGNFKVIWEPLDVSLFRSRPSTPFREETTDMSSDSEGGRRKTKRRSTTKKSKRNSTKKRKISIKKRKSIKRK